MSTSTALAAAFDLLQEEVETEVARVNQEGSAAFAAAEHDRAAAALARAKEIKALQRRCRTELQAQADALVATAHQLFAQTQHVDLTLRSV